MLTYLMLCSAVESLRTWLLILLSLFHAQREISPCSRGHLSLKCARRPLNPVRYGTLPAAGTFWNFLMTSDWTSCLALFLLLVSWHSVLYRTTLHLNMNPSNRPCLGFILMLHFTDVRKEKPLEANAMLAWMYWHIFSIKHLAQDNSRTMLP